MKTLRLGGLKALPLPGRYLLLQCFSLRGNEGTLHIKFIPDVGFTYGPKIMYGSSLGFGIPDWFNNKSSGSSVTLPMHSECDENRKWLGYAMFFLYQSSGGNSLLTPFQVLTCEEDTDPFSSVCIQFDCEFLTNYPQLPKAYVRGTRPFGYGTSVGVWAYIPAQWFLKHFTNLDGLSYITTSISPTFDSYKWKIKECGARLVYPHNASEFYESIAPSGSLGVEFYRHISYYLEKCSDDVQPLPFIDLVNKSVDVGAPLQYQLGRPLPTSSEPRGYEGCEFPDRSKVQRCRGRRREKKKSGSTLNYKGGVN
ncbi:hypothetical protein CJ030_MR0G005094 [Morella rubra]|uniref:C-JID domain-containing protein n=1 Tax=Morella rubra TaxID=262757 RepID=A0A6A1ULP1_9ROSI|nr:hypothetical protein CJ030_MR0G005094 [Morella rubra]